MELVIQNGRVIDPESGTDETLDILVSGGRISDVRPRIEADGRPAIDASRLVVAPGLVDMHAHLREPGYEKKETIASGTRAAARGGFTSVCAMPNTRPVNDDPRVTAAIRETAARTAAVRVFPIAAITRGSRGTDLVDFAALLGAGAVAFSDDGAPVADGRIMRRALEACRSLGALVIDHCEDKLLAGDGVMHEGDRSRRLGLRGIPASAEEVVVARDLILARELATRIHIAHLSTRGGVRALRAAKEQGVRASAEVTPHHLLLTDAAVGGADADFKMNPPLRAREDVEALVEGLASGLIDVIATDHAPHTAEEKAGGMDKAPFGVVGLETAVPLVLDRFVHKNIITLRRFVELLAVNPARLLGLKTKGRVAPGFDADLTFLNLARESVVDKAGFESRGRNTPFEGWKLRGQAVMTMVGGRFVYPFDFSPPGTV